MYGWRTDLGEDPNDRLGLWVGYANFIICQLHLKILMTFQMNRIEILNGHWLIIDPYQ